MQQPVDFQKLFADFSGLKIGVLGDVMLDTYWWGHVERISPEAPVPVVALRSQGIPHRRRGQCGAEPFVPRRKCFGAFGYWAG